MLLISPQRRLVQQADDVGKVSLLREMTLEYWEQFLQSRAGQQLLRLYQKVYGAYFKYYVRFMKHYRIFAEK